MTQLIPVYYIPIQNQAVQIQQNLHPHSDWASFLSAIQESISTTYNSQNYFGTLPPEIIANVFSNLSSISDVASVIRVCKDWKKFADNQYLWTIFCLNWWRHNPICKRMCVSKFEKAVKEFFSLSGKDWIWLSKCLSIQQQNGLAWQISNRYVDTACRYSTFGIKFIINSWNCPQN